MTNETPMFDSLSTKLIACAIIVACLLLGLAGLILPLIPGLLFIAIAAFVAAKLSPRFAAFVRENDTLRGYLDQADRIAGVPLAQKIQVSGLLLLKMLIDGVALLVAAVMKLVKAAEGLSARQP
ncbi:MAG TPA: DUF454 family protein [Gammaproteobacteria bacterium]|nr:DUF454 family protein [Gammaproteobacteria bacterium]